MSHAQYPNQETEPTHGWSADRKVRFLDHLAAKGNVRAACARVGLSREAAYRPRRRDRLFERAWNAALVLARDNSEEALADRAIDGVEEPIYYRGELVGTRRRYDSRLLLAHLARLDKIVDVATAQPDAGRFDELLACIAEGSDGTLLPDRARFTQDAAREAKTSHRSAATEDYWNAYAEEQESRGADFDAEDLLYLDEYLEQTRADRNEEVELARSIAAERWDNARHAAFSAVDALCQADGKTDPAVARLPYGAPPHFLPNAAAPDCAGPSRDKPLLHPWTVSTVSTSALARALTGPQPDYSMTPRSPFDAPRQLNA